MGKKLIIIMLLWLPGVLLAQDGSINRPQVVPTDDIAGTEEVDDDDVHPNKGGIFTVVSTMPEYPGGDDSLKSYLKTVDYPTAAKKKGLKGTAYVSFVVNKDGSLSDIKLAKSSGHDILDAVAIKHVQNMTKWAAGAQNGIPVRVSLMVPLRFGLGYGHH